MSLCSLESSTGMMNSSLTTLAPVLNIPETLINASAENSSEIRAPTQSLVYVIPGPVICAFGMVCNTLNLIVLSHKSLNESPYTYLSALSVSDLSLLTISFIILVSDYLNGSYFKAFFDFYMFFYFANVCFNVSVWIIVAMTIERAYFVYRPLGIVMQRWKTRIRIFLIVLLCLILNLSRLLCFKIDRIGDKYNLSGTEFRKSKTFYQISWVQAVLINFIPMLILTFTNASLIYELRRAHKARLAMTNQQRRPNEQDQQRMTRTLVAIVILFFICVIPSAFVDYPIAYALFGKGKNWDEYLRSPANQLLIYVSNLLLFLNSSLNFILYCVFNTKFRKAMKEIFKKAGRGKTGRTYVSCTDSTKSSSTKV